MILLSNLPGKNKCNGYYCRSILRNEMDISRNEVNMVNHCGNNCAKNAMRKSVSQVYPFVCHPEPSNGLAK